MLKPIVFFVILLFTLNTHAAQPDWHQYNDLLERHIVKKIVHGIPVNYVNYQAIFQDPVFLTVVKGIEKFPTNTLITKKEKLAFYINAYNIMAMNVIYENWPVKSIKDAGIWFSPVWNKVAGKISGKEVSLNYIENEILRPMGDPRIHFSIVCASLSCPDLRVEAFNANQLDIQLNDQVNKFLHNSKKGLNVIADTAKVSKIFGWFKDDFTILGGVEAFIKTYIPQLPFSSIEASLPYDWSLNGG